MSSKTVPHTEGRKRDRKANFPVKQNSILYILRSPCSGGRSLLCNTTVDHLGPIHDVLFKSEIMTDADVGQLLGGN